MNWDTVINALLLITTIVSTFFAIYYKRKDFQKGIEQTIDISSNITIFTSRDAMVKYLHEMYDKALDSNDVIWGQSISGRNYGDAHGKIVSAASRGVKFRMIFNENAKAINNIAPVFLSINSAEVLYLKDNTIRMQGLSDKEVVFAVSSKTGYNAIAIRDNNIVKAVHLWFDDRFDVNKTRA